MLPSVRLFASIRFNSTALTIYRLRVLFAVVFSNRTDNDYCTGVANAALHKLSNSGGRTQFGKTFKSIWEVFSNSSLFIALDTTGLQDPNNFVLARVSETFLYCTVYSIVSHSLKFSIVVISGFQLPVEFSVFVHHCFWIWSAFALNEQISPKIWKSDEMTYSTYSIFRG